MSLETDVKHANLIKEYLVKNSMIEISRLKQDSKYSAALNAFQNPTESRVFEIVKWLIGDEYFIKIDSEGEYIVLFPYLSSSKSDTLKQAFKRLNIYVRKANRTSDEIEKELQYYYKFAQIAALILLDLLFIQEKDKNKLEKASTTLSTWLNVVKETIKKVDSDQLNDLSNFIIELGADSDNRKDKKFLEDKVLTKWFIDTGLALYDKEAIRPTQYLQMLMEHLLDETFENYSSEVEDIIFELTSSLKDKEISND